MPYVFNPFTGNLDDTVPLSGGKVPVEYLPSYVDDVEEYVNLTAFPATGEAGKIYLAIDTSLIYRWSGSQYIIVGSNVSNITDLEDYNLRLNPVTTGARWNTKVVGDPAPGQFWQISSTNIMVDKFDSLGRDIITSLFPTYNPARTIWLSSDGITWVQRTAEISPDNNFTRISIFPSTAYTTGSTLFLETVDPTSGPATLPLANKDALVYNSGTQKWEPTPINLSFLGDVDTTTAAPTNGQALVWDQTANKWEPGSVATAAQGSLADTALQPTDSIDAFNDVDFSTSGVLTAGQPLLYSGETWVAGSVLANITTTNADPNFANVSLLLPCNGTDGSTVFPDFSLNEFTLTNTGSVEVDTSQSKFGGASAQFNAANHLELLNQSALTFGAGDFTIEFWFRPNNDTGFRTLVTFGSSIIQLSGGTFGSALRYLIGTNLHISMNSQFMAGVWQHAALCRSGTSTRLFFNGNQIGVTYSDSNNYTSSNIRIGRAFDGTNGFSGRIDDLRVTKGVARYTSNFTIPVQAYPGVDSVTTNITYPITNLSDVDTTTVSPTTNQALVWNGTNWVPNTAVLSNVAGITGASAITNCVSISQANYDAIPVKNPNTLYVIV